MWILFNQLVCEVTTSDHVATISLCSLSSDQQLGILGRRDEALLVETSFQEVQNITEEYLPSSLSSVSDSTAICSSDVKISLPDEDGTQPQSIQHASIEVPSVEPHEESINMSSYLSTDSSEMFHLLNNDSNQDDERGKKLSNNCIKSHLPYAYPFQAYHPIRVNQISPCSNNILITTHEGTSREVHGIDQCQFVHIEMITEGASITTCEEASDHILVDNDKWRISCFSKEEQEAIDAADELQAMHQQSLEENFICDSATVTIAEQPDVVLNSDITTTGPEFEEIEYTLGQEWLIKGEEATHSDEIDKEDITSSDPATTLPLENGSVQVRYEANDISEDVTDIRQPNTSFAEVDTFKDGGSHGTEEDKETETELVYRPQSAKVAASRTQRILQTVTSLPKKRGEYQPKKKKSSSDLVKTATNKSRDQKLEVIPNGAKVAKSPSTVKVDHRRVHFYTEEKSKAITAKLKSKESIEVVRRVHKDGTVYPHHHFKSDHLSALLHHGGGSDDNFPNKTPSTDIPSTFNRIFAAGDEAVPKARGVVQKLNTPFATEYNSTVYSDQTADQDDQTASQDNKTTDQDDQTANQDSQTTDQDDQTVNQDSQIASQDFRNANQDDQTADQYDHTASQGNQIAGQDDQTASQVDKTTNHSSQTADHTKLSISIENNNKISDDFNEEMSTLIKDFFSGTSTANGCPNQLESHDAASFLNVTEGHSGSEEHENTSTTEELSSSDKQCSSRLLGGDTNSSLVTDHSPCHSSTNHSLSQGDSSDEVDNSQELTPRKQWSSTQLVQSTPDSLNQVCTFVHHLNPVPYGW